MKTICINFNAFISFRIHLFCIHHCQLVLFFGYLLRKRMKCHSTSKYNCIATLIIGRRKWNFILCTNRWLRDLFWRHHFVAIFNICKDDGHNCSKIEENKNQISLHSCHRHAVVYTSSPLNNILSRCQK